MEFYAKNAKKPKPNETRLAFMETLRNAHESARDSAGSGVEWLKFVLVWKEIFGIVDNYYLFGRSERLKHDEWYSDSGERAEPGPVLRTFVEETKGVVRVLEHVYEDVVGEFQRVHANIEIETIASNAPSQMGYDFASMPRVKGKVTSEKREHPEFNPSPCGDFQRSRRIIVEIPYPCDRATAFAYEWVIAHEIGVHLFSQLANEKGPLNDGDYLAFSEGFMDAAILDVIKDSSQNAKDVPNLVGADIAKGAQLRTDARLSQDLPNDMSSERKVLWRDQVPAGCRCWKYLNELANNMDVEDRGGLEAKIWARRVALKLNLLDLVKEERAKFISGLQIIFDVTNDEAGQQMRVRQQHELAEFLDEMRVAETLDDAAACIRDCLTNSRPFSSLHF